jgi:hypothetical protein
MPPDAMEEDDDSEGSDDDGIAMPEGPAPDADTSDSDNSDDDIPMPPGPPPLRNVPPLPKGQYCNRLIPCSHCFYEKVHYHRFIHYHLRYSYL